MACLRTNLGCGLLDNWYGIQALRHLVAVFLLLTACADKAPPGLESEDGVDKAPPGLESENGADKAPRRYEIELLYVIHRNLTPANYRRIEALFTKVYPDFDLSRLEPVAPDRRDYYAMYQNRLLGEVGADPKLLDPDKGFETVQDQIDRELRLRAMFNHLLADARRQRGLRVVFDRLVRDDDAKRPVCATEPSKGLLVLRHVTATSQALVDLEDSGVRFGRSFVDRVLGADQAELPVFAHRADLLGSYGQGRHIFRLLQVHSADVR